jgi:hypothetical protein
LPSECLAPALDEVFVDSLFEMHSRVGKSVRLAIG